MPALNDLFSPALKGLLRSLGEANKAALFEQLEEVGRFLRKLVHRALSGRFVRPPAEQFRPVPKAIPGDVVVLNFDDELGFQGLPSVLLTFTPSACAARC